jgi:hypothetical protein
MGDYYLLDGKTAFGVWSRGVFFSLGSIDESEIDTNRDGRGIRS